MKTGGPARGGNRLRESRPSHDWRGVMPAVLLLVAGQAASLSAQESPPSSAPSAESTPAIAAPAPLAAASSAQQPPKPIRFNFRSTPYDQVLEFLARECGLPVIREAPVPDSPVTFTSADEYSLEEALDVLNMMLRPHGVQLRREPNYLFLSKIEEMPALSPVAENQVPAHLGHAEVVTVVVPLNNAQAAPTAEQLKPLVSKFGAITPLPQQNSLILVDSADQVRRLRSIIDTLDAEPPSDSRYQLFPLAYAKADAVLTALKGLVAEKRSLVIVDKDGNMKTVQDENIQGLNLQADMRTNSIIAVGPEARLKVVEELITLLDQPGGAVSAERGGGMMTFVLANIAPDEAVRQLTTLFASQTEGAKPTFLSIPSLGKITIVGSAAQLMQSARLLGEIDPGSAPTAPVDGMTPVPAIPETRAAVIELKHVTHQTAQSILLRLLSPRQQGVLRYSATPDERGLIITGPAADVAAAEAMVAGIDVPPRQETEVRQVVLSAADSASVLAKAQSLYGQSTKGQQNPVSATLDPDGRTVLLVGQREALTAFTEVLRTTETTATISRETRTFALERARATDAAQKLVRLATAMLRPGDGSPYAPPEVEPLEEMKSIVIRATPDQFGVLERLVKTVDEPSPSNAAFRAITMTGANPEEVLARVQSLYSEQTRGVPEDQAGAVKADLDRASGTLFLTANPNGLAKFTSLLDQVQQVSAPVRETRMIEVKNAKAANVAQFLGDLVRSSKSIGLAGGPEPVIEVVEQTNSLLIAAQSGQFSIIESLVRSLDSQATVDRPPMRILRLKTTEANAIAETLSAAYGQRSIEQRTKFPVEIKPDPATNSLIISAHPQMFTEIESLITQLNDTQAVNTDGREIRIFPLRIARAEELAQTIDQMYPQPPMPRDRNGTPRPDLQQPREIVVKSDRATNSLIVDAPVARLAGFEELVKSLDQQKPPENVEVRTYHVQRAQLDSVVNTIRSLAASGGLGVAANQAGAAVTVNSEPLSRTLILSGPAEIFAEVERVLTQLDSPPDRPELIIRMYPLMHARAERIQPLINRLLQARLREQQTIDGAAYADLVSLLDVASDAATNTLIISAPEAAQQVATELIKSLDTPGAQGGGNVLRVVPLLYADATQTASTVTATLPGIILPTGGAVTVTPVAGSNALLLSGAEADLKKVEEIVTTLDVRPVQPDAVDVITITLKHAEATRLQETVQRLLVEQQETDPRVLAAQLRFTRGLLPKPALQVRVETDARTNSLIVSGPASVIALAKEIVDRLDQPAGEATRTAMTFTPARARPDRLVTAVQPIVAQTMPAEREPVQMIAEPTSGAVVVIGSAAQVAESVKLLAEFDDRAVALPEVDVQVLALANADAAATAGVIQSMLSDRSKWPESLLAAERAGLAVASPTVAADAKTNRLIVSAPTLLMPMARELVQTLDQPAAQSAVEVKVFALRRSQAATVATALSQALVAAATPGEARPVVVATPDSNAVLVTAGADRMRQAEELIKTLDEAAQPEGVSVRTVYLKNARADVLVPVIEGLLKEESIIPLLPARLVPQYLMSQGDKTMVRFAPERRLNAVVVTGPTGLVELAEQIIQELDAVRPNDGASAGGSRPVRVIALENADASEVAASIGEVFKDDDSGEAPPLVRVDRGSNSLIVRGSESQIAAISEIVGRLDSASLMSSREMRMIPLDRSRADAAEMAKAIQRLLQEKSGTKVEVIGIDELTSPHEGDDKKGSDSRIFNSPFLAPWPFGGFQMVTWAAVAAEPPTQNDEESESAVRLAVDPATNSLIVVGSPRMAERIAALARQLQSQMPAEPGRLRVVTLPDGADAGQIASVVSQAVASLGVSGETNPGGLTGKVSVQADPAGGALIISANDTDFETVGELIVALSRPSASSTITVKIYPLANISATRARASIQDLLSGSPRGIQARRVLDITMPADGASPEARAAIQPDLVRVTASPDGGTLIVAAPEIAMPVLDRFLSLIDQSPVNERLAIRRLDLKNAKADAVSSTLQQVFDAAAQSRGSGVDGPKATFIGDERTNSILATGTTAQLAEASRLLETIDAPQADDQGRLVIVPLRIAKPSTVKQVVETVLVGRDPAKKDRLRISASDDSNLFVMRGTEEEITEANRIIAEVDKAETTGLPTRTVKLERANADAVATALTKFFDDRARASGRGAQQRKVAIVGDLRTATLVIAASDEDFAQIESMVRTFDQPAPSRDMQFRILPLKHARVGEIRRVLENMVDAVNYPPFMWYGPRQGEAPETLSVEFDERANSVILMGQGQSFETIERIITEIDVPREEGQSLALRAVKLEHASPRLVADAIEAAMASPNWQRWRGTDPDGVRVEADENARSIVLIGRANRLTEAAEYAKQLDLAASGADQNIESIAVKFAKADQVASSLQKFFQGRSRAQGQRDPAVSVIGSQDGNVVIVSAGEADMALVKELISDMDRPDEGEGRIRELYQLKNARAAELAATLREQFPRSLASREGLVIVTPQETTNALIVSAPPELFEKVDALVSQLDAPPSTETSKIVTVTLSTARAEDVAQSLSKALPTSVKITITPVRRTNSILLTGSDEAINLVMDQVNKLDTQPARSPVEFRRIPIQHAQVFDVASSVRIMVGNLPRGENDPRPAVSSNLSDNSILVSATTDQLEDIQNIIAQLDVPSGGSRKTEFIPLEFVPAEQAAQALEVFYGPLASIPTEPAAERVAIISVPVSNSLVISAEESQWPGIRSLLSKLDSKEYDSGQQLEIIALKHADAPTLARSLTEAFAAPLRAELDRERARAQSREGRRRNGDEQDPFVPPTVLIDSDKSVTVTAEVQTNSLIIAANRSNVERIKAVVAQIDVADFARLSEARIIPLRIGPASAIAQSIRQLFPAMNVDGTGRESLPHSVLIIGDDRANALIVRADEAEYAQIRAIADSLQQEGDKSIASVRVIRLKNVAAARLAATLRATFKPTAEQRKEPIAIEVDRSSNALVISSSQELFDQIRKVAEELDGRPEASGVGTTGLPAVLNQTVFIIDVENNSPEDVKKMLEDMHVSEPSTDDRPGVVAEPVSIVPMTSRRALAVIASAADGQTIVALARSLDAAPLFADQTVAMIHLKVGSADAVAAAIEDLLKPADQDAQTAPAAALAEQIRRLNIQRNSATEQDLALDLSKPIRVTAEPASNAVVVSSTPDNVDAVRGLIAMLDRLPLGDAVTVRFFPLQNAAASRIASVIEMLFQQGDRLRQSPGTVVKGEPTTEVGKALIGQIAVSVDERTNSLIVAGREEALALVEVMIGRLDADDAAAWVEPRLIQLAYADPVKLAEKLNAILVQPTGEVSSEAAALQRQVARLRVLQAGGDPSDQSARVQTDLFAPVNSLVIMAEDTLDAIIVIGSKANADAVAALVAMLDVPAASADNTVRIYPLKNAAADRISSMLKDIFRQQVTAESLRPEDDLVITADVRTNSLVVSTSPRSFSIVEALLTRLDAQFSDPLVSLHIVPVTRGDVNALAPKIERLMRERLEAGQRAGGVPNPSDTFTITPEPATSSLIVAASDENLAIVKNLIEVLTTGAEALADAQLVDIITAGPVQAGELLSALKELYLDKETELRGASALQVTADERLNALVVRGTERDIEMVRSLVHRLAAQPVTAVTEIKRIELTKADANEVVRLLQNVLAGRPLSGGRAIGSRQAQILRFLRHQQAAVLQTDDGHVPTEAEISGAIQEQVTITAERRTNSVVIVAPSRLMILIEDLVADLDTTSAGGRQIEIFTLKNADARSMAALLRELFNLSQNGDTLVLVPGRPEDQPADAAAPVAEGPSANGNMPLYAVPDERQQLAITVDARTNTLLVSATPEYLSEVRKVVEKLDSVEANEREQIVYELRNAKPAEVATTLKTYFESEAASVRQTLGPERAGSLMRLLEREVTVQGDDPSNRLIVGVSPRYREVIDKIIKELDSTPPQVMVQVILAEVTLDASKTWGADMKVGPFGGEAIAAASLAASAGVLTSLGVPNLAVSSTDFDLLIRSLEVQGRLDVLSRPQVLVSNNEPARIQVGENIAIIESLERLDNGNTRSDVTRKDVGIILNVVPTINADGYVRMEITPEISSVSARTTQISEDFQAPIINTRQVKTNVTVKDGETIVIGGLIQNTNEERDTKVPGLGDIPIVGELFRSHQYSNTKTELLVILTPKVVRSGTPQAHEELRKMLHDELDRMTETPDIRRLVPEGALTPVPKDLEIDLTPAPVGPTLAPPVDSSASPDHQTEPLEVRP